MAGFSSKTTTEIRDLLDPQSLSGLKSTISQRAGYMGENTANQQNTLNALLDRYESGELDKILQERVAQQSSEAQNRMLSQATTKAGSAFNTAAQAAAQKSTASALSEINVNAEQARQQYLTNLLDQYGNQTADYMNLLNTLSGQKSITQKTEKGWGGAALAAAGGIAGALVGGPLGAMVGTSIGASAGGQL
jgi:hypothetical protein